MKRVLAVLTLLLVVWIRGDAGAPAQIASPRSSSKGFLQTVRVRFWYLHPPHELKFSAAAGQMKVRTCPDCKVTAAASAVVQASGAKVVLAGSGSSGAVLRIEGVYRMSAAGAPLPADFPIELRADDGRLLITAYMPMEEYIAGVLAGETGNFKSEEALKAMSVAARTYAEHFGSRHALDGFDFCDTTHCQDLRIAGIDQRLLRIADSTAGEVLWYDGEPAATYYFANCGGTTEDGRYILGNDEASAPYLKQHSDRYCIRNGGSQWSSEVSKRDLQRALADDGIVISGALRSVRVLNRTTSGRVEFLRISGNAGVTVSGLLFRSAIGHHIGWDRLKSNWYDVSDHGDRLIFHGRGFGHGVGLCQVGAEIMGEEGHSYREILAFYYPGTHLGTAAQGIPWQQLANDDLELLTTRPDRDRSVLPIATRFLHDAEENTGLLYRSKPRLKVYATVAEFRNATGQPGWIAAFTRGRTIQLQPTDVLRDTGALDSTVHHELLHMLIESYARAGTPLWFREGLVLYLTTPDHHARAGATEFDLNDLESTLRTPRNEQDMRRAYAEAQLRVAELAQEHGKEALLGWLQEGLPAQLLAQSRPRVPDR